MSTVFLTSRHPSRFERECQAMRRFELPCFGCSSHSSYTVRNLLTRSLVFEGSCKVLIKPQPLRLTQPGGARAVAHVRLCMQRGGAGPLPLGGSGLCPSLGPGPLLPLRVSLESAGHLSACVTWPLALAFRAADWALVACTPSRLSLARSWWPCPLHSARPHAEHLVRPCDSPLRGPGHPQD